MWTSYARWSATCQVENVEYLTTNDATGNEARPDELFYPSNGRAEDHHRAYNGGNAIFLSGSRGSAAMSYPKPTDHAAEFCSGCSGHTATPQQFCKPTAPDSSSSSEYSDSSNAGLKVKNSAKKTTGGHDKGPRVKYDFSRCLLLTNLPNGTHDQSLIDVMMAEYSTFLKNVRVLPYRNAETKSTKCRVLLDFVSYRAAVRAQMDLDGKYIGDEAVNATLLVDLMKYVGGSERMIAEFDPDYNLQTRIRIENLEVGKSSERDMKSSLWSRFSYFGSVVSVCISTSSCSASKRVAIIKFSFFTEALAAFLVNDMSKLGNRKMHITIDVDIDTRITMIDKKVEAIIRGKHGCNYM